jgi:hypothetical protein
VNLYSKKKENGEKGYEEGGEQVEERVCVMIQNDLASGK